MERKIPTEKTISILGSTGSIGTQSLAVCRNLGIRVHGLTAHKNCRLIEEQAREFLPRYVVITDKSAYSAVKTALADTPCQVLFGMEGLCALAVDPQNDLVLNSVMGMIGLRPTLAALEAGNQVALANKETLVAGGKLVTDLAKEKGLPILPVDSEHSAIFQCLQGSGGNPIQSILLTASGGPFFGKTRAELERVTVKEALNHPNWSMGAKITVDSATLMNKGLEFIEAIRLFDVSPDAIQVVVHRESILHSAVEFADGSVIGQMGVPDMRIPIQYALTYPRRVESGVARLSLSKIGKLTFFEPDYETFACLPAAIEAVKRDGLAPAILNGANEEAVALFLAGNIPFLRIGELVREALERVPSKDDFTLEDVLEADRAAKDCVKTLAAC